MTTEIKTYNEITNLGSIRYVVNYWDGVKSNKDGSPFYDIAVFQNKRKKERFVRGLKDAGYQSQ